MTMEMKMPMVLDIISDNIIKHGNPLALKGSEAAAWAKGLDLPVKGEFFFIPVVNIRCSPLSILW